MCGISIEGCGCAMFCAEEEVGPESLEVAELLVQAMESRNMMRADPDRFEVSCMDVVSVVHFDSLGR